MEQQTHHLKHSTPVTLSNTRFLLHFIQSLVITLYNDRTICCHFKQPGCLHIFSDRLLVSPEHKQTNPLLNRPKTEIFTTTIIKTLTLLGNVCSLLFPYIYLKFPNCLNHILSQTTAALL
jgi:hypothetical protein